GIRRGVLRDSDRYRGLAAARIAGTQLHAPLGEYPLAFSVQLGVPCSADLLKEPACFLLPNGFSKLSGCHGSASAWLSPHQATGELRDDLGELGCADMTGPGLVLTLLADGTNARLRRREAARGVYRRSPQCNPEGPRHGGSPAGDLGVHRFRKHGFE